MTSHVRGSIDIITLFCMFYPGRLAKTTENWVVEGTDNTKYYINVCQSLNKVPVTPGCTAFSSVCRTKIESGQVGCSCFCDMSMQACKFRPW